MPVLPPFNPQHLEMCNEGLRCVNEAKQLMAKAEACGKDCSEEKDLAKLLEDSLTRYKDHFLNPMPGYTPPSPGD